MILEKDYFVLNLKSVQGTVSRSEVSNSAWGNVLDYNLICAGWRYLAGSGWEETCGQRVPPSVDVPSIPKYNLK